MKINITTTEILEALRAGRRTPINPDDAYTVREMVERTGWTRNRIEIQLRAIKAQGNLEMVTVQRERLDGMMHACPAYRFTKSPKGKSKKSKKAA